MPGSTRPRSWKPNASACLAVSSWTACSTREVAPVADVAGEEQRGVAGGAHHLHVRAGVARCDDGVGVDEQLGDGVDVAVADADHEDPGAEVVLEDPVGEHVGRVTAARSGEVGERLPQPGSSSGFVTSMKRTRDGFCRGEQTAGAPVPLARGPRRATPGSWSSRAALGVVGRVRDPVPLGDVHEHHGRLPVDAEVDRARRHLGPERAAAVAQLAGEVHDAGGELRDAESEATSVFVVLTTP